MRKTAKYKVCRRLGPGVYEKCQTEKFALSESRKKTKQRGQRRRRTLTDYGRQLIEKQRVRVTYGVPERQFQNYIKVAVASKNKSAQRLFELLELRLDNVAYRLGLAPTRRAARQMVSHGHIMVNGKRMKVPSYEVKPTDTITIREASREKGILQDLSERLEEHRVPEWLIYEPKKHEAKMTAQPVLDDKTVSYDLTSVIEFYSR